MAIQDALKSWFLRNVIKPRTEELDTPGFVATRVGGKGTELREVFLPESLLVQIEDNVLEQFSEGDERLYAIGKRFGWRYASIGDFPQTGNVSEHEFTKFFDFFMKYIEIIYASNLSYTLDTFARTFEMEAENYSVCRKNGRGQLLTTGAVAGVVAYLFEDKTMEAVQPECQGRGDKQCEVYCGRPEDIEEEYCVTQLSEEELSSRYRKVNEIQQIKHGDSSIKDLMDKGFFDYNKGIMSHEGERYVPAEASLIYLLETQVDADQESVLFESAYSVGKSIGEGKELSFINDYLPALGWGGVKPVGEGEKVHVSHYPWTKYAEETTFAIFRGFISGIISGIRDKEIRYEEYETNLTSEGLGLILRS